MHGREGISRDHRTPGAAGLRGSRRSCLLWLSAIPVCRVYTGVWRRIIGEAVPVGKPNEGRDMGRRRKLLERILGGRSDANIPFDQTRTLLRAFGFSESIRGSHHKFVREDVEELINLQEVGGKCKPYQVRQMREVLLRYNLEQEL